MSFYESKTYMSDLHTAMGSVLFPEKLFGASVMIAGASGLIGSYIVDILLLCNEEKGTGITIYAADLSLERLRARFAGKISDKLVLIEHNVNDIPAFDYNIEYIIHAASNAYPAAFEEDPVGTIMSNIQGTKNLLDYGLKHGTKRLLYISSGEVYGQGDLKLESFDESYGGYIDPVSTRSCYPGSKRTAETLCVSYTKQFGVDTVIVRPSHTYGANATTKDNRANVQFINSALAGEDIILHSAGTQMRSYTYIADTASAILSVLNAGKSCEAYNIAYAGARTTVADFAKTAAALSGVQVVFAEPDAVQKAQHTPIAKQVLDSTKIEALGWQGCFTVNEGIKHTLDVLKKQ